ncbi:MAG: amidase [Candidatus Krumholzibacteria bacterium]|nr:amidase [Candidatus Krumholzibacteria bacterium]
MRGKNRFIAVILFAAMALVLMAFVPAAGGASAQEKSKEITKEKIAGAEAVIGLEFTESERDSMLQDLIDNLHGYMALRGVPIPNSIPPALDFNPIPAGFKFETKERKFVASKVRKPERPENLEELAFMPVRELAELVRTRKVSSIELTKLFLDRLKKFGPTLECVITLTEERALESARRADEEIAAGKYRGLLHGIPYGAKDLLAVKGYPTTWGAAPYRDQVIDEDAAVIKKLDEAGAVLVAKLTMGALAWGDVWFGGKTRNPWNLEQGSSGSSAGSASATAAGLVPFAIGTETWGSIVSPSTRCGATGLRPTYGRVSRTGAMALSWSMDKIGPICRTVEDCAIVFEAIRGADGIDRTLIEAPFNYDPGIDIKKLRIGYLKRLFDEDYENRANDEATLEKLRGLGCDLVPIELPDLPVDAISFILSAEAAAAFDELTRTGRDDLMVRQTRDAWPNVFRASRLIPAVEYIQANRLRYLIIEEMQKLGVDVWLSPSFGGSNLLLTNLTGHPCVVLPNGFDEKGCPASVTFMGKLFGEAELLAVAKAYQDATGFHLKHPPEFR